MLSSLRSELVLFGQEPHLEHRRRKLSLDVIPKNIPSVTIKIFRGEKSWHSRLIFCLLFEFIFFFFSPLRPAIASLTTVPSNPSALLCRLLLAHAHILTHIMIFSLLLVPLFSFGFPRALFSNGHSRLSLFLNGIPSFPLTLLNALNDPQLLLLLHLYFLLFLLLFLLLLLLFSLPLSLSSSAFHCSRHLICSLIPSLFFSNSIPTSSHLPYLPQMLFPFPHV